MPHMLLVSGFDNLAKNVVYVLLTHKLILMCSKLGNLIIQNFKRKYHVFRLDSHYLKKMLAKTQLYRLKQRQFYIHLKYLAHHKLYSWVDKPMVYLFLKYYNIYIYKQLFSIRTYFSSLNTYNV